MTKLVKLIKEQNLLKFKRIIKERLYSILDEEKVDLKKCVNGKIGIAEDGEIEDLWSGRNSDQGTDIETLPEGENLDEARFKIVRVRIKRGKIERRRKVSTQKGFTFRGGKLTRMLPKERRNRVIAQRRGKLKRRGKIKRALRKRKRSLRRKKALTGGK